MWGKKGNHEDIMVTARYGFQNEVGEKYGVSLSPANSLSHKLFLLSHPATQISTTRSIQRYIQLVATLLLHQYW